MAYELLKMPSDAVRETMDGLPVAVIPISAASSSTASTCLAGPTCCGRGRRQGGGPALTRFSSTAGPGRRDTPWRRIGTQSAKSRLRFQSRSSAMAICSLRMKSVLPGRAPGVQG